MRALTLSILFGLCLQATADTPNTDDTVRNPFARQAKVSLPDSPGDRVRRVSPRLPTLQAVLASGANSVANIDGTLLRIGDKYKGYTLISVSETTAVIRKGGRETVLQVEGDD